MLWPVSGLEILFRKFISSLIRKTITAATVMFAVMKMIQKIINAVPVMPVEMYQTISKHIMFQCHCCFLWQTYFFEIAFG